MSLPTSMVSGFGFRFRSGIIIGLTPSTGKQFRVELQRSTQFASTASSLWTSFLLDPTSALYRFQDVLPLSTRTYYYKARHTALGYGAGLFTAIVNAKPALFPEIQRPIVPNVNSKGDVEIAGNLWMTSSKTAKVGTIQTTGTITKTHRIRFEDGFPDSSTQLLSVLNGYVIPGSSRTVGLQAAVLLTPGVRVTKMRIRSFRGSTGDQILANFTRVSSTGGTLSLSTANVSGATGWITTTGGAVSETISTQYSYYTRVVLNKAGTTGEVRFMFWEFLYAMPDYQKVL